MRVQYCPTTYDIHLTVSPTDLSDLEKRIHVEAKESEFTFHLLRSQTKEYIRVTEPRVNNDHYFIGLSASAYDDLITRHECGHRFGNSSKIKVRDETAKPE